MQNKSGTIIGIALTVVALLIGLFGIAILIGVGEAANNTLTAFAAVSFPFALLAGFMAWLAPGARWPIAVGMSAPVTVLSILGSWSSAYLIPGALWTLALTFLGAYLGGRMRLSKAGTGGTPPS